MPPSRKLPPVTHALAERHEALWLRLTALHKQISGVAGRKPETPLEGQTRIVAEALLADAWVFSHRGDRLPIAAPDHGGVLAQLGQALAELENYELRHTAWNKAHGCFMWAIKKGPEPVRRLRPLFEPTELAAGSAEMQALQQQLERRINAITKGSPEGTEARAHTYPPRPTTPAFPGKQTYPHIRAIG